jgi:hypothetical protein
LRVKVWKLFGPFQKPFFVPWHEISPGEKRLLFFRYVSLLFGTRSGTSLTIRRRTYKRIAAIGGALPAIEMIAK